MFGSLNYLDGGLIALYFFIVFGLAWWVTIRMKKEHSTEDYFLGGKDLSWFVIGASLFASNIGSEHLVGLAGAGASGEFAAGQFELLAALILILLGWVFVPFYLKSGVFTMPEFLEKRYSTSARNYLSIVSIIGYILTKISLTILAGAIVFEVMGMDFWMGAIITLLSTGIYTILGGLRAVIYTDMLQMFVLIIGSLAITIFGLKALGGWEELEMVIANSSGWEGRDISSSDFFNLWHPADDNKYPWTGIIFGAPILGVWYWCTDQFIVQRVLSARNISHARRGTLFGGFLKILPIFIFVIPGVIAYALAQKGMLTLSKPEDALPGMVNDFLPNGLKGLVLAGLLAALMSSLSSVFNSCSTLFTIDFYKRWRPQSTEGHLVLIGQMSTVVLVALSLAWIPVLRNMLEGGGSFYSILQSIQAYISPPIAAAFLLGLFFKRLNSRGAIWSLWVGFALGVMRLVLEVLISEGLVTFTDGSFGHYITSINFLHYAVLLFLISVIVLIGVSLTAPAHSPEQLKNVTYYYTDNSDQEFKGSNADFWWTIALIIIVILVWIIFSPWGIV